eukprot:TRINITY_DN3780_c0_g1_i1.p1 TRINITY_DN3780_c0_g1~~TRINITY_DN3780_c0_g1_i1.p1  ORF type:complete len:712 (+),score=350.27 TRINITY_DN3780_c0_g1_i1:120-2138(+)
MGAGGKMKASLMAQMRDEEQIARAIDGKGEPKRKKRKPWWERKNWWVGKVPQQSSRSGEEQVEAVAYYPPVDLPSKFSELGLEKRVLRSLHTEGFTSMTEIQRRCIPELLSRRDMLGQAKTGSGKTLAFAVPMLSDLLSSEVNQGYTRAIIISPTKELCHQICTVVNRILSNTGSSCNAKLITGGTKVKAEAERLRKGVTVVVATPGRLLDHMRHTKQWRWKKMVEWLVIDEADRVLMEGFVKEVDAILQHLADCPSRTTALFSATMARGMQDLGRLSFYEPPLHITDVAFQHDAGELEEHRRNMQKAVDGSDADDESGEGIGEGDEGEEMEEAEEGEEGEEEEECFDAEEGAGEPVAKRQRTSMASKDIGRLREEGESFQAPVPNKNRLRQVAMVVEVHEKLVRLYKLLRELDGQGAKKIIVFFASCASAQFHNMMLNTILNGELQCLMLHGKMKHRQRVATFDHFCREPDGVLFCTDVVARGLDIPAVEWIIQYDPPTDPSEYLHRVGRTARGGGSGSAMLMLLPKEVGFLDFLTQHGIDIERKKTPKLDTEKYIHKMHQIILRDHILEKNARSAYKATVMAYQQHTLKKYFNAKELPLLDVGKAFCLGDTAPQVHLAKGDGERAPYVSGVLKSMKQKYAREKKWEKGGKAKKQWSEDGRFIGRKQKQYI